MRRNRRDDEERRPRDMWGATSREKAKPTIGSSSRKLFFGPVVRECTLPDGGVGRVDHLRSRLGTLELVALSTDARSSFLSTATLDPRGADPLCSIADAGNNFSPSGFYSTSNPRGESQFTHFTSIIFPDVWANSIGSRGTLSLLCICDFRPRCYKYIDSAFHLVSAASTLPLGTDASWYSFSRGSPVAMARSPSS